MDKKAYLQIRSQNTFPIRYSKLLQYGLENLFLMALIFALGFYVPTSFSFLFVSPLIAIFMFRSFGFMHEATHGSLLRSKNLNDLLGVGSGAFCMLPFEQWKESHILHHYWSGNVEKDPVMALVTKFPKFPQGTKQSISFLWKMWFPILSVLQHFVFWTLSFKIYFTSEKSFYKTVSLVAPIVLWGSVATFVSSSFILYSLIPAVLIYLLGTEVVNLPHHLQLPQLKEEQRYLVWEQYKSARTCLYPESISSFFVLNFNYHAEHHMFPEAPWYYLPEIQKKILPHIGQGYQCDQKFAWIRENRGEAVEAMLGKLRASSAEKINPAA